MAAIHDASIEESEHDDGGLGTWELWTLSMMMMTSVATQSCQRKWMHKSYNDKNNLKKLQHHQI